MEARPQRATKEYLRILELAAKESEARVEDALRMLLEQGEDAISAAAVEALLAAEAIPPVTSVEVAPVDLSQFDALFTRQELIQ